MPNLKLVHTQRIGGAIFSFFSEVTEIMEIPCGACYVRCNSAKDEFGVGYVAQGESFESIKAYIEVQPYDFIDLDKLSEVA